MTMQRCLGIDYGSRRIGIAISDPLNIIARPLKYINASSDVKKEFQKLLEEFEIKIFVIGMPYNLKGEKGQAAMDVEQFITDVLSHFPLEIVRWDERFSTKQVHQTLREMNVKKKQRQSKEMIDAMAAAVMLQSYLDNQHL